MRYANKVGMKGSNSYYFLSLENFKRLECFLRINKAKRSVKNQDLLNNKKEN